MNLRNLIFLLPLTLAAAGCAKPAADDGGTAALSSEVDQVGVTATAGVRSVDVAVYDLEVKGSFPACASSYPELVELHIVHPRRNVKSQGTIAMVMGDPDVGSCSLVQAHDVSFRVRLDARFANTVDPEAIHQISPHMDSDYVVRLNGRRLGVLSVGLPYLMAFNPDD